MDLKWDGLLDLEEKEEVRMVKIMREGHDVEMEHPLAMIDGVTLTDNRELIEMDVRRLGQEGMSVEDEKAISNVLRLWVKMNELRYRQGMHEICHALYVKSGKNEMKTMKWFSSVMKWLYEMFYEDESVNKWISEVFEPMLWQVSGKLKAVMERNGIETAVWCVKWCRLLLLRELGFSECIIVWTALFEEKTQWGREQFFSGIVIVMLLNIGPELFLSLDQPELLQCLLHYPGLRISAQELVHSSRDLVAFIRGEKEWIDGVYDNLESAILAKCNPEWYRENKDIDINRLRMQSRLKKRVAWRLKSQR